MISAFVEDPGALNVILPVLRLLKARGHSVNLLAAGKAVELVGDFPIRKVATTAAELPPATRVLIVGTAENQTSAAHRLIQDARLRLVPSAAILDSATHLAWRFRGPTDNPLAHCPDVLLLPDTAAANAARALGLPEHRLLVTGNPHFDAVRVAAATLASLNRASARAQRFAEAGDRFVLVFLAELSGGIDPQAFRCDDYTLKGPPGTKGRTELVIASLLAATATISPAPYLVLRLHPKMDFRSHQTLSRGFDAVSAVDPLFELLWAADAAVGMTSMAVQEACLLGRPTLSILPRAAERDWLPTIAAGFTDAVWTAEAVRPAILRLTSAQPPPPEQLTTAFPAGATGRAADAVETLMRLGPP